MHTFIDALMQSMDIRSHDQVASGDQYTTYTKASWSMLMTDSDALLPQQAATGQINQQGLRRPERQADIQCAEVHQGQTS